MQVEENLVLENEASLACKEVCLQGDIEEHALHVLHVHLKVLLVGLGAHVASHVAQESATESVPEMFASQQECLLKIPHSISLFWNVMFTGW